MAQTIDDIVKKFRTTPFLFIGSGMSRRYLNFPNWEGLLSIFCQKISSDKFEFPRLKRESEGDFARLGLLLEKRFNDRWHSDESIRSQDEFVTSSVMQGCSPFKSEIAFHLKNINEINHKYDEEVEAFRKVFERSVSGVITTNYDKLIEKLAPKYKVYASQEELIFSALQGFGEIYKIHGSVEDPNSIVITSVDYDAFNEKAKYLASKLLTIFVEYPVVFLGYSMNDENIRNILVEITKCVPPSKFDQLADRFVFVQHGQNKSPEIRSHSVDFSGVSIPMTVVTTDDYLAIYNALLTKKAGYPVHMLRLFKEGLYNYAITGVPSKHCVVEPYDQSAPEDSLIFSLGVKSNHQGLVGISAENWYTDVLFDDLGNYSADDLFDYSYRNLNRRKTNLPVFKLLSRTTRKHPDVEIPESFDDLLTSSIKKYRDGKKLDERSVKGILKQYPDEKRRVFYLPYLREDEIDVDDLEAYLKKLLNDHPEAITSWDKKSYVKRLIRIYDWLKYGR